MIRIVKDACGADHVLLMSESIELEFAKRLDEGYFKSYPDTVVFRRICKLLHLEDKRVGIKGDVFLTARGNDGRKIEIQSVSRSYRKDDQNDANLQLINMTVTESWFNEIEDELKSILSQCGWFVADKIAKKPLRRSDVPEIVAMLEPKFPIDSARVDGFSKKAIERIKKFYHVTFAKYAEKIRRFGLLPSNTSRNEFFHPERIYLFGNIDDALEFKRMHEIPDSKEFSDRERINRNHIGNTKKVASDEYQLKDDEMALFRVDVEQCVRDGKSIQLYHDPRWLDEKDGSAAFFTQNSIPPKYVKEIKV